MVIARPLAATLMWVLHHEATLAGAHVDVLPGSRP